LEKKLGYRFSRRRHLETALTHRSFRFESTGIDSDNQRLEFLGDAALGLLTGAYLFEKFPDFQEGDLTRVRSQLTNTKTLARIAASIDLGAFLRLGRGEQQTGGQHRSSNLGDSLEAIIGGAFVDGGLRAVKKIFHKLFAPEVESAVHDIWGENPKGALQETSQRRWKAGPRYRTIKEEGPAHERVFTVEAMINGQVVGTGHGLNKRAAEMDAARQAMLGLDGLLPKSAQRKF
jgi:ribonuclease-3